MCPPKRLLAGAFLLTAAPVAAAQERASLADTLHRVIVQQGIGPAIARYHALARASSGTYQFGPPELNRLGYRLLGERRLEAAVAILRLNTEIHPSVANGFDSLADGWLWLGLTDSALAAFRQVLAVAPRDTTASPSLRATLTARAERAQRLAEDSPPVDQQPPASPRLRALEAQVAGRGEDALRAFRREREAAGGPLVEALEGRPDRHLVTFVWFAETPVDNVVVESWLEARHLERRVMRRLGASSLWYRSYEVPAGLRMGYLLSPNDRRLSRYAPIMTDGMVRAGWVLDPLNPRAEAGEADLTWSVLQLPGALDAPWLRDGRRVAEGQIHRLRVSSFHLEQPWDMAVYTPPTWRADGKTAFPLVVFLDGFGFFDVDRTHLVIDDLIRRGELPPLVAAFVYNPGRTRNRDMSCHGPTHAFLRDDLVPRLRGSFRAGAEPSRSVIAGRSRSGLGAVCAAFSMPDLFGKALAQSGSFWWAPDGEPSEWLARTMSASPKREVELYLEAGLLEDSPNPATGLSMLTVTRHLRDVARAKGYRVHAHEFTGGHDPTAWRVTLLAALRVLLVPSASGSVR